VSEQLPQLNVTRARAKRLTYKSASSALIEECQLADLKDKNVTIETLYSGISRGTESLVYHGKVPVSERSRMKCPHQIGDFSYPVSYGYACVGKVIETQSDVSRVKTDDLVFVLHPHQDFFQVHEDACNLIPSSLPTSQAVLSANMETALNAIWDADLNETQHHMVIGAGVVGLLTAFCLKSISGHVPTIVDINPEKKDIAEKLGLNFLTPDEIKTSKKAEYERFFNTSASDKGLQLAIDKAGFEAKIIEMSWYGDKQVNLKLGGAFHSKRLQIISSQVGHVAPTKRSSHSYSDRMQEAMKLLSDPSLTALLEPEISFETLPDHLHDIFNANSSALCQLVTYNTA
jgi:2-desacetyl-2-hydroxyethyl bacteriochlorophyllide A dehydrogenase